MRKTLFFLSIVSCHLLSCDRAGVNLPSGWDISYVNSATNTLVDSTEQVTIWYEIDGDSIPMLYQGENRTRRFGEQCNEKSAYDIKYLWRENIDYEVYRNRKIQRFFIDYAGTTDTLYFSIKDRGAFQIIPNRLNDKPFEIYRDCFEPGFLLLHLTAAEE